MVRFCGLVVIMFTLIKSALTLRNSKEGQGCSRDCQIYSCHTEWSHSTTVKNILYLMSFAEEKVLADWKHYHVCRSTSCAMDRLVVETSSHRCQCVANSSTSTDITSLGWPCTSDRMCLGKGNICMRGSCQCHQAFFHNTERRSCVKHCKLFGNEMVTYDNMSISGRKKRTIPFTKMSMCIYYCVIDPLFDCVSVQYRKRRAVCELSDLGWNDVSEKRKKHSMNYIFGQRTCLD